MPENDPGNGAEDDGPRSASMRGPAWRRRWRRHVLAAVLLLVLAGVAWLVGNAFGDGPSAPTTDVRREILDATLWADAAAAQVVLADVRADVTGALRPDEIRAEASDMIDRVQAAVTPLERSDALGSDEVNARLAEFGDAVRVVDARVTEALDALSRLVAKVGP